MKRAASDIVEVGERLIAVKEVLGHGKFGDWLNAEFEWTVMTANRTMRATEFVKSNNLLDFNVAPSALYLLASPATPPEVRDEVIAAAKAGEKVTHADVRSGVVAGADLMNVARTLKSETVSDLELGCARTFKSVTVTDLGNTHRRKPYQRPRPAPPRPPAARCRVTGIPPPDRRPGP